ncbi:MAG: 3-dehydroquinate synthase [Kiritimatiellaeota bacterium]|nr:3-dehydroquinate synthase [Kiritimatiellota bacterium]
MHIFLYGPPGSGKSTLGRILADRLGRAFVDLDKQIAAAAGQPIPAIFAAEGEAGFRAREAAALSAAAAAPAPCVISLGGGALLDTDSRARAERAGQIVFLDASAQLLEGRCARRPNARPLLNGGGCTQLLAERAAHYASFPTRAIVTDAPPEITADNVQAVLGLYAVTGMGPRYDVRIGHGLLPQFGAFFADLGLGAKTLIVGDANTVPLHAPPLVESLRQHGIPADCLAIPAGEATKTIATVSAIWDAAAKARLDRKDALIALGGGVVGDLTGFAAATWMRGIRWVNVPTTLLAMADSSIGGKTGADLPAGKNLIGAFHAPSLVLADTSTLETLPTAEMRCGLAEVIKHAIIADPALLDFLPRFACCAANPGQRPCPAAQDPRQLAAFVARAMRVKINIITADPYEQGDRAKLNLGHTIGHALEKLAGFAMPHGNAVAIGTVAEARLAEAAGLAARGFADAIAAPFASVGLPTALPPGTSLAQLWDAMRIDKKNADGEIRFALPAALGDVRINQVISETLFQTLNR